MSKFEDENDEEVLTGNFCPECNYPLVLEYGIEVCYHCGFHREESDD